MELSPRYHWYENHFFYPVFFLIVFAISNFLHWDWEKYFITDGSSYNFIRARSGQQVMSTTKYCINCGLHCPLCSSWTSTSYCTDEFPCVPMNPLLEPQEPLSSAIISKLKSMKITLILKKLFRWLQTLLLFAFPLLTLHCEVKQFNVHLFHHAVKIENIYLPLSYSWHKKTELAWLRM